MAAQRKRIIVTGNPGRQRVTETVEQVLPWLRERAEIIGGGLVGDLAQLSPLEADLALAFGGDGTILRVGRLLKGTQIPIMGVNLGKLGFLAEFSLDEMRSQFDNVLAGRNHVSRRMMLECCVQQNGQSCDTPGDFDTVALNDVVISAGEPFRLIELRVLVGRDELTSYHGDGLIVSTPSGSTAYNMAAGGPLLNADLRAMVVTPICAHSLSYRPVVLPDDVRLTIEAVEVNAGTSVILDGQVTTRLAVGQRVVLRRNPDDCLLVENADHRRYHTWVTKLHWGRPPRVQ
ncbi:MAG: NAD kinase [Phycisphaerae bacterium]|nr:NAD kinase [Phycisphaerae bacterium]